MIYNVYIVCQRFRLNLLFWADSYKRLFRNKRRFFHVLCGQCIWVQMRRIQEKQVYLFKIFWVFYHQLHIQICTTKRSTFVSVIILSILSQICLPFENFEYDISVTICECNLASHIISYEESYTHDFRIRFYYFRFPE